MNILTAIALHFIADFPLQSEFLAMNKGKSWEILFYHVAVYMSVFAIFGVTSLWALATLGITHFLIDAAKARYQVVKHIWEDQLLHMIVLFALFF